MTGSAFSTPSSICTWYIKESVLWLIAKDNTCRYGSCVECMCRVHVKIDHFTKGSSKCSHGYDIMLGIFWVTLPPHVFGWMCYTTLWQCISQNNWNKHLWCIRSVQKYSMGLHFLFNQFSLFCIDKTFLCKIQFSSWIFCYRTVFRNCCQEFCAIIMEALEFGIEHSVIAFFISLQYLSLFQ